MMTCLCVLSLADSFGLDLDQQTVRVTFQVENATGTKADMLEG
jgi:hypothetical protein